MRKIICAVGAAALTLLNGCMTFEVESGTPPDKGGHQMGEIICKEYPKECQPNPQTVHGSLYGFQWSPFVVERCPENPALFRVEYHTNAAFILMSVVTLGLYVPTTVEVWCAAPAEDMPDNDDVWDPNEDPDLKGNDVSSLSRLIDSDHGALIVPRGES